MMIDDYEVRGWLDMWFSCNNFSLFDNGEKVIASPQQYAWPDGLPYTDQYNLVVEMFHTIRDEYMRYQKRGH